MGVERTVFEGVRRYIGLASALFLIVGAVAAALGAGWPWLLTAASVVGVLPALVGEVNALRERRAEPGLITGYLCGLVENLNTDTWIARERDDNSLPVGLVGIHQSLTLREPSGGDQPPRRVDELAESCDRLVILGRPGAGKTWAARRIAIRAAERAAGQLEAGTSLSEVELPFVAACSDVLEEGELSRWDRLINASLNWADNEPSDRPAMAALLRRHDKRLVILDGLDEASGLEDRALLGLVSARVAGTTRLIVTGRPSSWNSGLLHIDPGNDRHQVGELQPLSHADTIAAVTAWLADEPASRDRLLQLLGHPESALSRQASVPLLCAMFCLVARPDSDGDDRFDLLQPGRRQELYDNVIDRLLRATWRGLTPAPTDGYIDDTLEDATTWLEDLAAAGNIDDPATGLGNWRVAIQPSSRLPPGAATYVDNVAPLVRRDRRGGRQARQFVHRSIRDHLTAKALCRQPTGQLAETLVQHLWSDPDWAEVIPGVIVGHPQADELVQLLADAVRCVIEHDPTCALEGALVRAATITAPRVGPSTQTAAIDNALTATINREPYTWPDRLAEAAHWPATAAARDEILELLAAPSLNPNQVSGLTERLEKLGPSADQANRAAEPIIKLLTDANLWPEHAGLLAGGLAGLRLPDQTSRAADRILERLAATDVDPDLAGGLAEALVRLRLPDQASRAADRILELLDTPGLPPGTASGLAEALGMLGPSPDQASRAADRILDQLDTPDLNPYWISDLTKALSGLGPSANQASRAIDRILDRLDLILGPGPDPSEWGELTVELERAVELAEEGSPEAGGAANQVLDRIDRISRLLRRAHDSSEASTLILDLARLGSPQVSNKADRILDLLTAPEADPDLADLLVAALDRFGPSPDQATRGAQQILNVLATPSLKPFKIRSLARTLREMGPSPDQKDRAADQILKLLSAPGVEDTAARWLAEALGELGPSPDQASRAADQILDHLGAPGVDPEDASWLALALAELGPSPDQTRRAAQLLRHGNGPSEELLTGMRRVLGYEEWKAMVRELG